MQAHKTKLDWKPVKLLFGRYEEIPSHWEIRTFGEAFEFLRTGTNSRDDLKETGDVNYVHYGDIHARWRLVLDCDREKLPFIDAEKVSGLPLLGDGDLIIVDASEDHEGSGASVVLRNVKNRKIVSGLHTMALRCTDEGISPNFRTYLASIKFVKKQIIAYVTGISVYGLSKNNLKKIRIPLPTYEEQQKIASILSKVDGLIQKTDEIIEQTQRLKKGLAWTLFTKGIGHTKFGQSSIGRIPSTWELKRLGETLEICQYGLSTPMNEDGKYPIVRMNEIEDGYVIPDIKKYVDLDDRTFNTFKLENGDILFNRTNSYELVGRTGIFELSGDYVFASYLIRLRVKKDVLNPRFLTKYLILNNDRLKRLATRAVHQVNINATNLKDFLIPIPPIDEQERIIKTILSVQDYIRHHQKTKKELTALKKGLVQKLLTGQIRVKV